MRVERSGMKGEEMTDCGVCIDVCGSGGVAEHWMLADTCRIPGDCAPHINAPKAVEEDYLAFSVPHGV
jgi:hypothetical protein